MSMPAQSYNTPPAAPARSSRVKKTCAACGCIGVILFLGMMLSPLVAVRLWIKLRLDKSATAHIEAYNTEVLTPPGEWKDPSPLPSPEVVDFQLGFYNKVNPLGPKFRKILYAMDHDTSSTLNDRLEAGQTLAAGDREKITEAAKTVAPLIEETSSALHLPAYTANMLLYTTATVQPSQPLDFSRFCAVAALDAAWDGHCSRAVDLAVLPMRYMRYDRPAAIDFELQNQAVVQRCLDTLARIAQDCADPSALQHGLAVLDELKFQAQPLDLNAAIQTDAMAWIYRAKAFGYKANTGPQTRAAMMKQWMDISDGPYYDWALKAFPPEDARYKVAHYTVEWQSAKRVSTGKNGKKTTSAYLPGSSLMAIGKFVLGVDPMAIMSAMAVPREEGTAQKGQELLEHYEKVRQQFADRLAELQSQ